MKTLLIVLRSSGGLFLLAVTLIILSLLAGKILPYIGEIAYISTPTGYNRLYLMDVQREFAVHIKRNFVNDCCLTWSPDGQTLTFVSDMSSDGSTDIFNMNFRKPPQRLTTLAGADLYPSYSPDGQQIAYTAYGYGNPQIYVMNADGSQQHVLTGQKKIVNLNPRPVWSADGQSILFSDFANLDSLYAVSNECTASCDSDIHMTFNTNGLPLMTTSFLPLDQTRLLMAAFERTQRGGYGIYSLDTSSSNMPERLTTNSDLASPSLAINDHWIAFVSGNTDPQQPINDANLYILDTNCIGSPTGCSGSLQKVASKLRSDDNLSWSADGRWLAFVTMSQNQSHLNLLDASCIREHQDCAGSIHPLSVTSVRNVRPAWRPPVQ